MSGQIGMSGGALVDGGITAEVRQALANLGALLEGEGSGVTDIVKTTIFLRHISDFAAMNELYADFMGDHRPARATVAVAGLPLGALFEIEAWAWVGDTP